MPAPREGRGGLDFSAGFGHRAGVTLGQQPLLRSRLFPIGVIGLVLVVFAATLWAINLRLRAELRAQIAGRDARVLDGVVSWQELAEAAESGGGGTGDNLGELTGDTVTALMKTERLQQLVAGMKGMGVIGARLFDGKGKLITALPLYLTDSQPGEQDLGALRRFQPVSRFCPGVTREDLFLDARRTAPDQPTRQPILEVWIPLRSADGQRFIGATELLLAGRGIEAEFAALDRHLLRQAAGVFVIGGLMMATGLGWAFHGLQRTNRLLSERSRDLLQANAELALAAKTSAVGAVVAHLMHGLKNPLSGLQFFMASQNRPDQVGPAEWREAATITRRMQDMVQQIVGVLREEDGTTRYEVSLAELGEVVAGKARLAAAQAGVRFAFAGQGEGRLSNREANLAILILENLVTNAIQATPAGNAVGLTLAATADGATFEVWDEGPGFPEDLRPCLFSPTRSTKPGGSGVGLAICKQLAHHLGAELGLTRSTSAGCLFTLRLRLGASPRPAPATG